MMNDKEFKKVLKEKLNLDDGKIAIIDNVLNNHFILGKNNKIKIIDDLMSQLNIDEAKANEIYDIVMNCIGTGLKNRLKHPFGA